MLFLAGLMINVFQQHLKNLFDFFSIALALIYSIQVFGIQIFLNSPSTLQVLFTYPHFSCLYHQSCMLHIFSLLNGSLNRFTSGEFDFSYFPNNGFNFQKVLFCKLTFVSCIISSTFSSKLLSSSTILSYKSMSLSLDKSKLESSSSFRRSGIS